MKKNDKSALIDYKNVYFLLKNTSESGKIIPRRISGLSDMNQRQLTNAIKIARHLSLIPYLNR
jgi:small subunit ribosomal protein S18